MEWHDRFDDDHREACQACYLAYIDFIDEQWDEARMDALAELETMGVI